jgi:MFS superfamily sulfate permease-like transporter
LASIVFTIAIGMVDVRSLRKIRRVSPGEFKLAVLTAATVVAIGVEEGILLAIALSLLQHVRHSYRPHSSVFVCEAAGHMEPVPVKPGIESAPGLMVYRFGADLFYANGSLFADEVRALVEHAPTPIHWFVIEGSAITDIDYTAAQSLRTLIDDLKQREVNMVFARVTPYFRSDLDRHGITAALGEGRILGTLHEAIALARASLAAP